MTSLKIADLFDNMKTTYQQASSQITWSSFMIYGSILLTTWFLYKAFIQPLLSPLRNIPGMPFNPFFGNMRYIIRGEAMEATIRMMKEYGAFCRYYFMFGRERLMVADPDIMKHILVTNSKNYRKPPSRLQLMRMVLGDGLVMLEGNTHASHKRLMSPFFNNSAVKKMVPVLVERSKKLTDLWLQQIRSGSGEDSSSPDMVTLQVHRDIAKTTLDIVGKIAFGYDFNSLEKPEVELSKAFHRILTGVGLTWRLVIPYYYMLPMPDVQRFKNDCKMMQQTVMEVIEHKKKLLEKGAAEEDVAGDVLGQMLLARDEEGKGLTAEELQAEVMTLMLAGHETTAVGTSWCLLLLAQNPVVQERAREEVLRVLPQNTRDITWDHLDQLKYCSCIIKETLRLLPPVPLTLRQSLGPDHLSTKEGPKYYVPKGTISQLSMGPMMRRADLFESPNEFIPERFLESQTDQNFYNYLPFLIGHRMCIGYKFALMEMRTMLALFVRELHFETVPGIHYKRQSRITMRPSPSLQLRAKAV